MSRFLVFFIFLTLSSTSIVCAAALSQVRFTLITSTGQTIPWSFTAAANSSASDGIDSADALAPPAPPQSLFEIRLVGMPIYAMIDTRDGTGGCESWDLRVESWSLPQPWTGQCLLAWDLSASAGWSYVLQDLTNGTQIALTPGGSYAFQVTGPIGPIMVLHAGPAASTFAAAKALPDGGMVSLNGIVSGRFPPADGPHTEFYIQDEDRTSGILVSSAAAVQLGDRVRVQGIMDTEHGERLVNAASVEILQPGEQPRPVFVTNASMCGGAVGLQSAVLDNALSGDWATGLGNVGLLVAAVGRVTYVDPGSEFFYIDDGSALNDGSEHIGVRVSCSGLAAPSANANVRIVGNAGVCLVNSRAVRLLRPRSQSDITVVE